MRAPGSEQTRDGWLDPVAAVEGLVGEGEQVALLEATDGSGWSHLGVGSEVVAEIPVLPVAPATEWRPAWMGWLGYEGEARWLRVERSISFHHPTRRLVVRGGDGWRAAVERLARPGAEAPSHPPEVVSALRVPAAVRWRHDRDRYLAMIASCQEAIRRGDAYQLCLTNTGSVRTDVPPLEAYRRLRRASPTHHAGFLRLDGVTLVSASPEQFVEVRADRTVTSSPMKGTRRRDPDPAIDDALAAELARDEKERAENLMIVDLVRNDLSRIAEIGTVQVSRLLEVERYAQVHQLVSTVEARLRAGLTAADAVEALFPAGSMTGAPKHSAMRILEGLEAGPRGVYSGAFGMLGADGSADLAMVIRSIVYDDDDGTVTVGSGGGITALSVPEREADEVALKAAPLLAVLDVRERAEPGSPASDYA